MKQQGYIHLYTGNGKGKTTAAFGLAVRALCAGKSVCIGQFVKSMKYNETRLTEYFPRLRIEQLGSGCFLDRQPDPHDVELAREGLRRYARLMAEGEWDVVILDELCIALHFGLVGVEEVLEALRHRKPEVEIVITGRYAPAELIAAADLVTDMQEVRHYYTRGVLSRDGIDR